MMRVEVKSFKDLTKQELYTILELRNKIFVVEQNCVYQDIDGKDQKALHVLGFKANTLVAYTRIFKPNDYFEHASIGRVLVCKNLRSLGYGYVIIQASIQAINNYFKVSKIKISAQEHLINFYSNCGFNPTGKPYLEDNIPHITMLYTS